MLLGGIGRRERRAGCRLVGCALGGHYLSLSIVVNMKIKRKIPIFIWNPVEIQR